MGIGRGWLYIVIHQLGTDEESGLNVRFKAKAIGEDLRLLGLTEVPYEISPICLLPNSDCDNQSLNEEETDMILDI